MKEKIDKFFRLKELGTTIRTEVIAGVTTFMTMAYIIFVNPTILSVAGMDANAVMVATCVSSAVATLIMGLYAKYPIALAPGMGINAYFAYTVCLGMGLSYQAALGAVFISGVVFIAVASFRLREKIIEAVPSGIKNGAACGIGLLIAFIGLKEAGIVVNHPATLVSLGNLTSRPTVLALVGLVITAVLLARKVKGAILWGILLTALIGLPMGIVKYHSQGLLGLVSLPPSLMPTLFKLDIKAALNLGFLTVIFVFLFVDIFDTVGTLVGVGQAAGFIKDRKLPRANRALLADAIGTVVGSVCGTSTVTSYIESAAGISEGGRSGLTSVVTAFLFLVALFFAPLVRMIGSGYQVAENILLHPVTAPALIIVGSLMVKSLLEIKWSKYEESIPAFLTMIVIPLTFSIANGLALGFISFAIINLFSGQAKKVGALVYILAILFILRYIFLGVH